MMRYDRDQKTGLPYTRARWLWKSRRISRELVVLQVEVRRQRQQNVDVVAFAVELDQLATPIPAPLFGDFAKTLQHRRCDAVFGDTWSR
jgi:hypothetical protein